MSQRKVTPQKPADSLSEFHAYLRKRSELDRGTNAHESMRQKEAKHILREFERAQKGLFGVACFCGHPAEETLTVNLSRSGEPIGLCLEHFAEAKQAFGTITEMANAAWRALNPKEEGGA